MKKSILIGALSVLILSCASTEQKNLEHARFLLDKGECAQAIELVDPMLADDPDNTEAKFILGSALVGNFALEDKNGCQESDTGYLGILACLLDDKDADDQNGLKTFGRIAPTDSTSNEDINRAVETLVSIEDFSERVPEKDVALQRLVARAFNISATFQIAGISSPNVDCNAGGAGVDEIPDDYDATNINSIEAARFRENLEGIQADAIIVGFEADFNLIARANNILEDLDGYGVSTTTGVRALFDDAYNTPAQQVCN